MRPAPRGPPAITLSHRVGDSRLIVPGALRHSQATRAMSQQHYGPLESGHQRRSGSRMGPAPGLAGEPGGRRESHLTPPRAPEPGGVPRLPRLCVGWEPSGRPHPPRHRPSSASRVTAPTRVGPCSRSHEPGPRPSRLDRGPSAPCVHLSASGGPAWKQSPDTDEGGFLGDRQLPRELSPHSASLS